MKSYPPRPPPLSMIVLKRTSSDTNPKLLSLHAKNENVIQVSKS